MAQFTGPIQVAHRWRFPKRLRKLIHAASAPYSLTDLARLAHHDKEARAVLTGRATALAQAVTAAVDLVDADAVGLRIVVDHLLAATSSREQLRIQRADEHILRTAAIQVALHPIRQDPLGFQLQHDH